jgi:hypothetical protein
MINPIGAVEGALAVAFTASFGVLAEYRGWCAVAPRCNLF